MSRTRTVLVLGGGTGGVVAATRLRKLLPSGDRVVVVDQERQHLFQPSLLWLAVGARTSDRIQRPLNRLERRGIDVVTGKVADLDPEGKRIRVNGTDLKGDAMVLSLGAELCPQEVPGLFEGGHNLYSLQGASGLRDALETLQGGRVVVLTAEPAYKCPAAPYEAAMLVQDHLRRSGGKEGRVEIFAAEAGPMGTAGPHPTVLPPWFDGRGW